MEPIPAFYQLDNHDSTVKIESLKKLPRLTPGGQCHATAKQCNAMAMRCSAKQMQWQCNGNGRRFFVV